VALPHDKQSLNEWFDTSQFRAFPSKTTDISNYPAWTGVQNLPGANYKPAPGDSIKNGVYQDFANYVRYYPTRWSDVRASRVNSADIGVRKNLSLTEHTRFQLRIDAFNAFNHPLRCAEYGSGQCEFRARLSLAGKPIEVHRAGWQTIF